MLLVSLASVDMTRLAVDALMSKVIGRCFCKIAIVVALVMLPGFAFITAYGVGISVVVFANAFYCVRLFSTRVCSDRHTLQVVYYKRIGRGLTLRDRR